VTPKKKLAPDPDRIPLSSRPGYLVRRLHQIHSAIFYEECREFRITPVQYGLITALQQHPGSDQVTLGREVGIDRTNVADVLERLAERGLITRSRSGRDRRSMLAYLTPEGQKIADDMYKSMQRAQERLLKPLQPEFRSAFLAMLTHLVNGNAEYAPFEVDAVEAVRVRRKRN
jgi:DNA-binding MarR family transcriptional regulator